MAAKTTERSEKQQKLRTMLSSVLLLSSLYHIETSPLIRFANQWPGFYMIESSVMYVCICLFVVDHKNVIMYIQIC